MPYALTVLDGVRWNGTMVVGHRPRALLEALVAAGSPGCSADRLVEAVWGDDLPATPTKALQVLVSRVRNATDARVVERTERGYRLGLGPDEVDALARANLLAAARAAYDTGDYEWAAGSARAAVDIGPGADASAMLGLAASRAGDHGTALPLLESLVDARPDDDEVLCCLLRSEAAQRGPAAALERYERHRRDLDDRLGSDPGPAVQAVHRELLAADRPVRSGLRYDGTPLLGRDADRRRLLALLSESRVLSIVGAGGLGKTRLAQVLGRDTGRPVVHFVELVGVSSPDDVIGEVGSALGVRDSVASRQALTPSQRADVRARIAQHLDAAPTLLILDNCEHVVDAVADLVAFLVATTRDLRVLTTTRAPLNIAAERVYALGQLDRPDAVELFRERATAARPSVVLDDAVVDEVVARLDGLPLAIELAAAKVRVMSVEDIGHRLHDRFTLLRGADRTAPDRHQTLLAVIDWSWNLLDEQQRRALRQLSVFHDGFGLDAAEAMLGETALESLEELARQSLLTVGEAGSTVRYRMLETVREFGRVRLGEAGEERMAVRTQRRWACAYADAHLGDLMGPGQFAAMDAIRAEEGNVNDVLRQSLADGDPDVAVVLLAALGCFWSVGGEHSRIIGLLRAAEDALADWTPPPEREDHARAALSVLLANAGIALPQHPPRIRTLLERLGSQTPVPALAATCTVTLAVEPSDAAAGSARVDELCRSEDRMVALLALQYRCHLRENDGAPQAAVADATRALELVSDEDGPWQRAILHTQLAQLHAQLGQDDVAAEHAREALPVLDRLGADDDAIQSRAVLAVNAMMHGDYDRAEETLAEIERAAARRAGLGTPAVVVSGQAELALMRGQIDTGLALFRSGLERVRAVRFPGMDEPTGLEPWTLFGESVALTAYALHGSGQDGADLWERLRTQSVAATDPQRTHFDYPVVGLVLFALGTWGLLREALPPRDAVRLLVFADRFAYNQIVPTMRWHNAAEPAERVAPGLIGELCEEYGDRSGPALLVEVRAFLSELFAAER